MGLLDQVSNQQSDYRELLKQPIGAGGPTLEEETLHGAVDRYGEDTIINAAVALRNGPAGNLRRTHEEILSDAVRLLDNLDTLGMEVRFKNDR